MNIAATPTPPIPRSSSLLSRSATVRLVLLTGLTAIAAPSVAQTRGDTQSAVPPRWEVGALGLGIAQQAYPGSDQMLQRQLLLPYVVYRGEVVRADRETTGLRALRQGAFELDLGAAASLAVQGDRIEARRGLPGWGTLVELGPRLRWTLHRAPDGSRLRLDLPLRAVVDVQNGMAHRGTVFEPELRWQRRLADGWFFNLGGGAVFGDERMARTYYGVAASAATPLRPAYEAQAGLLAWRLSASTGRRLGNHWNGFAFARFDSVAGAANEDSPLVRQTHGATLGLGLSYVWRRSSQAAAE